MICAGQGGRVTKSFTLKRASNRQSVSQAVNGGEEQLRLEVGGDQWGGRRRLAALRSQSHTCPHTPHPTQIRSTHTQPLGDEPTCVSVCACVADVVSGRLPTQVDVVSCDARAASTLGMKRAFL